jgi:malonyl-CoA O-methyltransferase
VLTLTYADLKSLMRDLKGLGAHNAAAGRGRGLFGRAAWTKLEAAYEAHRRDGRLPATWEVVYGHAWVGDKRERTDGRQVIEFKIAERQRRRGMGRG